MKFSIKKIVYLLFFISLAIIFYPNVSKAEDKYCLVVADDNKSYTCQKKTDDDCGADGGIIYETDNECNDSGQLITSIKPVPSTPEPKTQSTDPKTGESTATEKKTNKPIVVSLQNPLGEFPKGKIPVMVIMGRITKAALGLLGSVALLVFVYGGFMWLTSAGKSEQIKKGTDTMIWAVIGIFIIFSSYAILETIMTGLGAKGSGVTTPGASKTGEDWCLNEKEKKCAQFTGTCNGKIVDSKSACEEILKTSAVEVKKE